MQPDGQLKVTLIAKTMFYDVAASKTTGEVWNEDVNATPAASLAEFAGRACYESWSKPNYKTRSNEDYLRHIQEVGHWSVLEHGTATFYIQGVSRSLTHELIRHRHFSPSQLSQRFVLLTPETKPIIPPLFEGGDDDLGQLLQTAWEAAVIAYEELVVRAEGVLATRGITGLAARKEAREAARCVLPNMTPTAIVLTGNHRTWREMFMKRIQPGADAEIRRFAFRLFQDIAQSEPHLYQDLRVEYDEHDRERLVQYHA